MVIDFGDPGFQAKVQLVGPVGRSWLIWPTPSVGILSSFAYQDWWSTGAQKTLNLVANRSRRHNKQMFSHFPGEKNPLSWSYSVLLSPTLLQMSTHRVLPPWHPDLIHTDSQGHGQLLLSILARVHPASACGESKPCHRDSRVVHKCSGLTMCHLSNDDNNNNDNNNSWLFMVNIYWLCDYSSSTIVAFNDGL